MTPEDIDARLKAMSLPELTDLHRVVGMGVAALQAAEKAGFNATAALIGDEDGATITLSVTGAAA